MKRNIHTNIGFSASFIFVLRTYWMDRRTDKTGNVKMWTIKMGSQKRR